MLSGFVRWSLYSPRESCSLRSLGVGVGEGERSIGSGGVRRRLRGDLLPVLRGAVELK